jgi:hypothetical protein
VPRRNVEASVEPGIALTTPLSFKDSPIFGDGQGQRSGGDFILHGELDISLPDFPSVGDNYLGFEETNININDFLTTMSNPSPNFPSLVPVSTSTADGTAQGQEQQLGSRSPTEPCIPPSPSFMVRSLIRRPKLQQPGTQRISSLIFHTLKSYPLMMLHHEDALPPFIHPSLVSKLDGVAEEDRFTAPLTNCISLMHMLGSEVRGTRKLFWKNVRMECERLLDEVGFRSLHLYFLIPFAVEKYKMNQWQRC